MQTNRALLNRCRPNPAHLNLLRLSPKTLSPLTNGSWSVRARVQYVRLITLKKPSTRATATCRRLGTLCWAHHVPCRSLISPISAHINMTPGCYHQRAVKEPLLPYVSEVSELRGVMARPKRFELLTPRFVVCRLLQAH